MAARKLAEVEDKRVAGQRGIFMNFDLTDEQKDIVKAAREFAEKEFPDAAQECDREEKAPKHLWEKACELGFVGVFIPETYGGAGLGYLEHCIRNEKPSTLWRTLPGESGTAGTFPDCTLSNAETKKNGVKWYFIEDESPWSETQIPQSLRYLELVKF